MYPSWRRKKAIKRWYKALHLDIHVPNLQKAYTDINGFILSRQARKSRDAIEYTYGEVHITSFIALLTSLKPNSQTVFYDLGSGVGKTVLASAMVFNIQKSCGVELFKPLHDAAIAASNILFSHSEYQNIKHRCHWIHGNFLELSLNDATLIFINSSALIGETWEKLNWHLQQLKPKSTVITTTKKLSSPYFQLLYHTPIQMSFGIVEAFIHERIDSFSSISPN